MLKLATKVASTALLAIVGLTAFSGSANASRSLSLSPAGNVLAISLGKLTFRSTIAGAPINVIACNVTLHGSVSRIFPKRSGTLFGKIHTVLISLCTSDLLPIANAEARLIGSGWKLVYQTFLGRLPTPSGISAHVIGARFLISLDHLGMFCLYQGNVPATFSFSGLQPNTTSLITIPSHTVPLNQTLAGSQPCPANGQLIGSFQITPTQTLILVN